MYLFINENTSTWWPPADSFCQNLKRWKAPFIVLKLRTRGWHCFGSGIIFFFVLLVETAFFTSDKVCKWQNLTSFCNHYPVFILNVATLGSYYRKNLIWKSSNIVSWDYFKVLEFQYKDTIAYLLECNVIYFRHCFEQRQMCQLQPKTIVFPIQWVQWRALEEKQTLAPVSMVLQQLLGNEDLQ